MEAASEREVHAARVADERGDLAAFDGAAWRTIDGHARDHEGARAARATNVPGAISQDSAGSEAEPWAGARIEGSSTRGSSSLSGHRGGVSSRWRREKKRSVPLRSVRPVAALVLVLGGAFVVSTPACGSEAIDASDPDGAVEDAGPLVDGPSDARRRSDAGASADGAPAPFDAAPTDATGDSSAPCVSPLALPGPPALVASSTSNTVIVKDLDGDGLRDVVVGTGYQNAVDVFFNLGGGAFTTGRHFPVAIQGFMDGLLVEDVNGDGKPDLVLPAGDLIAYLNDGTGAFGTRIDIPVGGASRVAAGDLNGDGRLDFVTDDYSPGTVNVLLSTGPSTFAPRVPYHTGAEVRAIVLGDLDMNGRADLVVSHRTTSQLDVWLNDGAGALTPPAVYPTAGPNGAVAVGDLTGDGRPDIVVAGAAGSVWVHVNGGAGAFPTHVETPLPSGFAGAVALGDVDGDGKPDVVATGYFDEVVRVLRNNGTGALGDITEYSTSVYCSSVALADVTGDGKPDLLTGSGENEFVTIRPNVGGGRFVAPTLYPVGAAGPVGPAPGLAVARDLNGDGKPDLATANYEARSISVLLNAGTGFAPSVEYPVSLRPWGLVAADLDGDGRLDLATTGAEANSLRVLKGVGAGTFGAEIDFPTVTGPGELVAGDFDGDGKIDLATISKTTNTLAVMMNGGAGAFRTVAVYPAGAGPIALAAGDLNGDGAPDLAVANENLNSLGVYFNSGTGTFPTRTGIPTGYGVLSIVADDLDGDGRVDLATTGPGVTVYLNGGSGTFPTIANYRIIPSEYGITVGDLTGDGRKDLVTVNGTGNAVSVLPNLGGGRFGPRLSFPVWSTTRVAVADFDGDGRLDFATPARRRGVAVATNTVQCAR